MPQILLLVVLLSGAAAFAKDENDSKSAKVLNLFQVVRFPNEACNTTVEGQKGICYTNSECEERGGLNMGSCASGFGVCCSFSMSCGAVSNQNNTYFTNSIATTDSSPCTAKICKCEPNVCQLRLDFVNFTIAGPDDSNLLLGTPSQRTSCNTAQFTATSDGVAVPVLCGENSGYHMYLEAQDNCNTLAFSWISSNTDVGVWNIRISQILCGDPNKPPEGCLQWFTGSSGTIESWNFNGGIHLANQNYFSCIRAEQGMCAITYSAPTFAVSLDRRADVNLALGNQCTTDYVYIPQGRGDNPAVTSDRYCGTALVRPADTVGGTPAAGDVVTIALPYIVGFVSDGGELDLTTSAANEDAASRGYQITYSQSSECPIL